ncbi:MAG: peptidylprolyl isomerase [Planctomycetota bacterium]
MFRLGLALGLFMVVACGCHGTLRLERSVDAVAALQRCEARDVLDDAVLKSALADSAAPELQRAAVRAIGRIGDARGVEILEAYLDRGLAEPAFGVEMAFALGQLASDRGLGVIERLLHESESPVVRRRAVEALGKLHCESLAEGSTGARVGERLVALLQHADAELRGEAALGLWRRDEKRFVAHIVTALQAETDDGARWRMVYALARLDDPSTVAPLRPYLSDSHTWVSLFAARGLRTPVDLDPAALTGLAALLAAPQSSWVARAEALETLGALAKSVDDATREQIRDVLFEQLFREPMPLVVERLLGALRHTGGDIVENVLLALARGSASPTVRRAAVENYGLVAGPRAVDYLASFAAVPDVWLRAAAARGLAAGGGAAQHALLPFLADAQSPAREAAVRSYATVTDERGWARVHELAVDDAAVAVRLAAIEVMRERQPEGWQETFERAFRNSTAPSFWEARTEILRALAADAVGVELAREALTDPFVSVRRVASRLLAGRGESTVSALERSLATGGIEQLAPNTWALPENPHLVLGTERGEIVIELFPRDAPRHVASVTSLARAGRYDGLTIHRVVPAFVVQGGDPSGDGSGDAGYFVPDEINPRPYDRGAVGMPKTGEPDTGGCQFFITHVPTPHLDGRYTVFGHVVAGMAVVDQLEVGDRILSARVLEEPVE